MMKAGAQWGATTIMSSMDFCRRIFTLTGLVTTLCSAQLSSRRYLSMLGMSCGWLMATQWINPTGCGGAQPTGRCVVRCRPRMAMRLSVIACSGFGTSSTMVVVPLVNWVALMVCALVDGETVSGLMFMPPP